MLTTPFCLMLTCLQVSPDSSQFFRYDSITLSCSGQMNSTDWKVKRRTASGVRTCAQGWGFNSSSNCTIRNAYPSDSGVYWCESDHGAQSISVNITITDLTVILQSPALPVAEGAAVTLRCKSETSSPDHVFHFYKDGRFIRSSSKGEMTIHSASKTDEGLYKCNITGGGASQSSWLAVDASSLVPSSAPPAGCGSLFRLLCHLLVGTPYLLSTILLGLIYRDRRRAAQAAAERRGSKDVVMETAV